VIRKIAVVAVLALLIGATAAMADARGRSFVVQGPNVSQGQIYNAADILVTNPNLEASSLPAPQDPNESSSYAARTAVAGPASLGIFQSENTSLTSAANTMVAPRGGGFMSTRQRADHEISRLIRALD